MLNSFLEEVRWRYDQIGLATALLGLGTLLFQAPAGVLVDRVKARRLLFLSASNHFSVFAALALFAAIIFQLLVPNTLKYGASA